MQGFAIDEQIVWKDSSECSVLESKIEGQKMSAMKLRPFL